MEKHTAKKNKQTRQDRRQRIRQERKKDRRFLRMTVPLLTLLAALLLGGLFYWETHKAALYARWAYAAMEREDMEAAERMARTGEDAGETGLQQRIEYAYAGKKLEAAAYEEAESLFLELGAYEDAPQKALQCRYELAMAAMAAGDYVRAEEDLRKAAGYGDALQQLDACRYAMAEQAETGGELDKAFSLFWELGDYRDARDRAAAAAIKKTGETDPEKAILLCRGYTQEQWADVQRQQTLQEGHVSGMVAAGWAHALGLTGEGKVLSAGDNTYGQCNTQAWENVSAVAAGARHSLALTKEGKVLSTGDNEYGQCDTAQWENVMAIAAGDFDSYGLTREGMILHCGYGSMESVASWQGIKAIAAGNSALGALREDGSFLCTMASQQHSEWKGLTGMALNLGWSAGLTNEGTVLCEQYDLSEWKNILALYSSETLLAGLKSDGTLAVQALRPWVQTLAEELKAQVQVQALALSGSWALCVHEDGSLTVLEDGPEACSGWQLGRQAG